MPHQAPVFCLTSPQPSSDRLVSSALNHVSSQEILSGPTRSLSIAWLAETVRALFRLYLELGTVRRLKEAADRLGLVTKRRQLSPDRAVGGQAFTRGHLYQLLSNPIYVGEVVHKGVRYAGRHEPIIDRETFGVAQARLNDNAAARQSSSNSKATSLLSGLIYDETRAGISDAKTIEIRHGAIEPGSQAGRWPAPLQFRERGDTTQRTPSGREF